METAAPLPAKSSPDGSALELRETSLLVTSFVPMEGKRLVRESYVMMGIRPTETDAPPLVRWRQTGSALGQRELRVLAISSVPTLDSRLARESSAMTET